jgi:uncharacterized protein
VTPQERIEALDILRGFALFGILLVNITQYLDSLAPYASRADEAAEWLVDVFASWKFFPLFSFLFGVGFAIQLTRAQARQVPFLRVYLRRLAVLLLIGAAFYVFVEREDILLLYAVLGAPLLLFRNRSPRALLLWAMVFLAPVSVGPVQTAVRQAFQVGAQEHPLAATERAARYEANEVLLEEAMITGDYRALVAGRARRLFLQPPTFLFRPAAANIFSMFLFGFYAHRRGVFKDLDANRRFVRQTLYWSVGVWVALTFAVQPLLGETIHAVGRTALTISYMATVVLLLGWGVARRLLTLLGWTGRMGLTNYVLHFVIMTTIFYGYGLGLYHGPGQAMGPVFAVLVTLVPIPLSVWWLRRFRFGPLEWLWRSLTYGRRQPMLIAPATRSAARVPYLRAVVAAIVILTTGVALAVWEPPERRRGNKAEIAKLEGEWRSALLGADTAALGRIATTGYGAQLGTPVGTSGETTTLPQLIELIASRTLRFDAITPGRVTVVAHEHTGSASGLETQVVSLRGVSAGGERRYVHWYVKRDGRWRLAFSYLARVS